MGYPVPGWDAVGQIGICGGLITRPQPARSLPSCQASARWDADPAAIVYYLNMYVRRSRARAVIQETEHLELSERDSLRVLAVLENPPKPNAKLLAAAKSLPKRK